MEADHQLQSELLLRHGLIMLFLTFPSGWLLTTLVSAVHSLVGMNAVTGLVDALLLTLLCGIAGHVQWFVLLPTLWRRWKARRW